MKNIYLICILLLNCILYSNAFASDARYNWYINFISDIPEKYEKNLTSLVEYLTYPMENDYDKAQAFAYWIASHIIYDQYLYNNGETTKLLKSYENQTPQELLESRIGICADFAALFNAMCKKAGIKSGYISGFVFEKGKNINNSKNRKNSAHGWNYFIYKGTKIYVDTTFMAKGKLKINGKVSKLGRKRAIRKNERKKQDEIYPIDPYYFDFSYKYEYKNKGYERIER